MRMPRSPIPPVIRPQRPICSFPTLTFSRPPLPPELPPPSTNPPLPSIPADAISLFWPTPTVTPLLFPIPAFSSPPPTVTVTPLLPATKLTGLPLAPVTGGSSPLPPTAIWPCVLTLSTVAICPTESRVRVWLWKSSTCTWPRCTLTDEPVLPEVTVNRVPLTTAARNGVSIAKCCTFSTCASTEIVPKYCFTVVNGLACPLSRIGSCVLGPTSTVSWPRVKVAWPLAMVRIISLSGTMPPRFSGCQWLSTETNTSPRNWAASQSSASAADGIRRAIAARRPTMGRSMGAAARSRSEVYVDLRPIWRQSNREGLSYSVNIALSGEPLLTEITDEYMRGRMAAARAYTLVLLKKGPAYETPDVRSAQQKAVVWEHVRRNMRLKEEGTMALVGPLAGGGDIVGISVFTVPERAAKALMEEDPGVDAGIFTYEIATW